MKHLLPIAIAGALAIPTVAAGAVNSPLYGSLDDQPGSTVKIRSATKDGETTVKSVAFRQFEVPCDGGRVAILKRSKLTGSIAVGNKRGFRERNDNGETVFKIRGKFKRGFDRATGTFRYFGSIRAEDGVVRDCDSGKMSWSASADGDR